MEKILVFALSSFFVFALDVPYFSDCLNNYVSVLKVDEKELGDCINEKSNNAKKDKNLAKENAKRIVKIEEKFLFEYWKLLGLFFILYIFMFKRTGNFFWLLFFFSDFFGYDKKYEASRRSGGWIPFDPADFKRDDFSSDDRDSFPGNSGGSGGEALGE